MRKFCKKWAGRNRAKVQSAAGEGEVGVGGPPNSLTAWCCWVLAKGQNQDGVVKRVMVWNLEK